MGVFDCSKMQYCLFDCDGVILNSNKVKTEAFEAVVHPFGEEVKSLFLQYHLSNGGVTRQQKFRYLFENILKMRVDIDLYNDLLNQYSKECIAGLINCEISSGLLPLFEILTQMNARAFVVSGGAQVELNHVFRVLGIDHLFEGIFGNPLNKYEIVSCLDKDFGLNRDRTIFFGDSRYDYEVASKNGLEFVFCHKWSEFEGWSEYFINKKVLIVEDLLEFRNILGSCNSR